MLRDGYSRHHLPCYGFGGALAGILASVGTAAGTTTGVGAGVATGTAAATAATSATAAGLGTAGAAGISGALGGAGSLGIGLGGAAGGAAGAAGTAAGTAATAGTVGTIAAAAGPSAVLAPGTVAAATSFGSALAPIVPTTAGGLLQGASLVGSLAGAGNSIYSGQQQAKAAKVSANAAAKQARAEQISYQDRVRDVLSLNVASAAARGVANDGSAAALQLSNLEGGQLDLANIASDASTAQRLYGAARRRASLGGYLGAGQSVFTGLANMAI